MKTAPLSLNPNCTQIYLNTSLQGIQGGIAELTITVNGGTPTTLSVPITPNGLSVSYTPQVLGIPNFEGLIQVDIQVGSKQFSFGVVGTCSVDCCIAKLTESAINCTCKCDKCKEELDRAKKIFLLLQSSIYAAEQAFNFRDALDKYNKAKELCTEVCACGC